MVDKVKKANREAVRKAILARKEARKAENAARWEKMRAASKAPQKFEGVLNSLIEKSARQADAWENLRDHLDLHRVAAEAPAKARVAAARKYAKGFKAIAFGEGVVAVSEETPEGIEAKPEILEDALREAYKGLDEQAAAIEMAAQELGIELNATPVEQAFGDEGKAELEHGEEKGEEEAGGDIPDFGGEEKSEEKTEEPKEEKEEDKKEDKPEEKEAAAGSDSFVTDRDKDAQPRTPSKVEIPQSQGASEVNKGASKKKADGQIYDANGSTKGEPSAKFVKDIPQAQGESEINKGASVQKKAMSRKDYILLADAIKSSGLPPEQQEQFARHLSQSLKRDNGQFKEEVFVDYTMGRAGNRGGAIKKAPAAI